MTPTRTEFQVVPTGAEWEIRQDSIVLLTVQTKQVAIDEAVVQAELAKPSHIVVQTPDGSTEEEANLGDLPGNPKKRTPRRRTTSTKTDDQDQRDTSNTKPPTEQPPAALDQT